MTIVFELKSSMGDDKARKKKGKGWRVRAHRTSPSFCQFHDHVQTSMVALYRTLYIAVPCAGINVLEPLREELVVHGNNHLQVEIMRAVKQEGGSWFWESLYT